MSELSLRRLCDLTIRAIGGGTPSRAAPQYWGGNIPWASVKDLRDDSSELAGTQEWITPSGLAASTSNIVDRGTILVAMRMAVGRSAIAMQPVAINQDLKGLVPDTSRATARYLLYVLKLRQPDLVMKAIGSTVLGISTEDLLSLCIYTPPLSEQHEITMILDVLGATIRNTEQILAKLRLVKHGLLHDVLTRGIDESGELRDPTIQPDQFANSEVGQIPNSWRISSVDAEFKVTPGLTLGPHRRPRDHPYPYLRVANVFRDRLDLADVAHLNVAAPELAGRLLEQGDLVIVEGHANPDEIGRCAMITSDANGFTFQNHLFRLQPHHLNNLFALAWLNSDWVRGYWRRVSSSSSGLNTINSTKLKHMPVVIPSAEEQYRIADAYHAINSRMSVEERLLEKLARMRSGLQADLLTGRVRATMAVEATPA